MPARQFPSLLVPVVLAVCWSLVSSVLAQYQVLKPRAEYESDDSHYGNELAFFGGHLVIGDHDRRSDGYDTYAFEDGVWTLLHQQPEWIDGHRVRDEFEAFDSMLVSAAYGGLAISRADLPGTEYVPLDEFAIRYINDVTETHLLASTSTSTNNPRLGYGIFRWEESGYLLDDFIETTVHWRAACITDSAIVIGDADDGGDHGLVGVYRRIDNRWQKSNVLASPADGDRSFGYHVSCWKDRMAVLSSSHVSVFRWEEGGFIPEHLIRLPDDARPNGLELRADFLAASYTVDIVLPNQGSTPRSRVILHRRDELGWRQVRGALWAEVDLDDSGWFNDGYFGETIAMNDEFIAIAAPSRTGSFVLDGETRPGFHFGEVHVYALANLDLIGPRSAPQPPPVVELAQSHVYPNPVSDAAELILRLPEAAHVSLHVFDAVGRKVADLADGLYEGGEHIVRIDAASWPAGVYFVHGIVNARTMSRATFVVL